jgi:HSP20 family molecular chaperone IbpA
VFPLVVTVTDAGPLLTIEAPVPGFAADEIELCIEPRRVTITGQRAAGDAPGMQGLTTWMFRAVDLPEDVDTCDATASVEDFILEVTLRKAAPGDEK